MSGLDIALMEWLRASHAPWLDTVMSVLTISGIMAGIWQLVALVSLFLPGKRAAAWRVLLAVWLALFTVDVLIKPAVARVRPMMAIDVPARLAWAEDAERRGLAPSSDSFSFPSGHATSAFAGAFTVSRIWPQARVAWWTLALLIGYSRIYLGHHYPLDVTVGALLGLAIGYWVSGGRMPASRQRPTQSGA